MSVKIFFCYAHEDELLLNKLKTHLRPLQRQGIIEPWHDRDIRPGTEWKREIDIHLNQAQIILLLFSPDFMDSEYCYGTEMKRAIERHELGEARVIPIFLRPVYWKGSPFGKLQALPTDGKPIISTAWHSIDEALFDVVEDISAVIDDLSLLSSVPLPAPLPDTSPSLEDILNMYKIRQSEENVLQLQQLFSYMQLINDWIVFTLEKWRTVSNSQLGWKPLRGRWSGWDDIFIDAFPDEKLAPGIEKELLGRFDFSKERGSSALAVACFIRDIMELHNGINLIQETTRQKNLQYRVKQTEYVPQLPFPEKPPQRKKVIQSGENTFLTPWSLRNILFS